MEEARMMKDEIRKQNKETSEVEKAGDKGEMEEAMRMKEEIRKQKKETSEVEKAGDKGEMEEARRTTSIQEEEENKETE
ncbi:hypothetical protein CgunFtcFv8_017231 [Champsocephalus gunnari]|uniref:Uncharacterized protein n=1 Tax=Champsocephalus gunnari TaxID=52237 RepID=A0AAN8DMC3_CHAGU|nr:hypothetical protein CgunFtcFv8_017231 [Champsocephalus gunnari]